ncbi:MAG: cupin domain-containing protein [Xanthobacter sp.]
MTVFDATNKARTFNFRPGDVDYVPRTLAHYIENIGETPVRVLNVFNTPLYKDVSLNQWLALAPPDLVRGHLNLDEITMKALRRERASVSNQLIPIGISSITRRKGVYLELLRPGCATTTSMR